MTTGTDALIKKSARWDIEAKCREMHLHIARETASDRKDAGTLCEPKARAQLGPTFWLKPIWRCAFRPFPSAIASAALNRIFEFYISHLCSPQRQCSETPPQKGNLLNAA
jgi:hypothetical protein